MAAQEWNSKSTTNYAHTSITERRVLCAPANARSIIPASFALGVRRAFRGGREPVRASRRRCGRRELDLRDDAERGQQLAIRLQQGKIGGGRGDRDHRLLGATDRLVLSQAFEGAKDRRAHFE